MQDSRELATRVGAAGVLASVFHLWKADCLSPDQAIRAGAWADFDRAAMRPAAVPAIEAAAYMLGMPPALILEALRNQAVGAGTGAGSGGGNGPKVKVRPPRIGYIPPGRRLAQRRAEMKLSQAALAGRCGINRGTLIRLETGQSLAQAETVCLLEKALAMRPGELKDLCVKTAAQAKLVSGFDPGALKRYREAAGLSRPALAPLAKMSATWVRMLETGQKKPTYPCVEALAAALGVTAAQLLTTGSK
jgi:transcriptional regulator with XRE-family HTH domain